MTPLEDAASFEDHSATLKRFAQRPRKERRPVLAAKAERPFVSEAVTLRRVSYVGFWVRFKGRAVLTLQKSCHPMPAVDLHAELATAADAWKLLSRSRVNPPGASEHRAKPRPGLTAANHASDLAKNGSVTDG
jgi:hypothetical protein